MQRFFKVAISESPNLIPCCSSLVGPIEKQKKALDIVQGYNISKAHPNRFDTD
ncbi:MAG: hypothetical protein GY820_10620 [Gammaproteobacteria bacterium]|nr:hypothetical protein [Gammaproteobacteria bacterium]